MRVAARPPRAVLVAACRAAILVLVAAGPCRTSARPPAGPRARSCTRSARSNRAALHRPERASSGAYGKYQIMPSNWPAWAKHVPRQRDGPEADPGQPGERGPRQGHGAVPLARHLAAVAYWWLTGSERNAPAGRRSRGHYVTRVMTTCTPTGGGNESGHDRSTPGSTRTDTQREAAAAIVYRGSWSTAGPRRYAGRPGHATPRDAAPRRCSRSPAAQVIAWYRPGRSDPRQRRVYLDGKFVPAQTVDLPCRGSFKAPGGRRHMSRCVWKASGRPVTLRIVVIGPSSHPMVAIAAFVVRSWRRASGARGDRRAAGRPVTAISGRR